MTSAAPEALHENAPAPAAGSCCASPAAGRGRACSASGAASITATSGITFGGRGYGDATPDGKLRGNAVSERVARRGGAFRIDVPPASAALVTVAAGR